MPFFTTDQRAVERLRRAYGGTILTPTHESWDDARRPWQALFDQRPAAVALPGSPRDVADAIRYARERRLRVAPQGTGHNAPALGSVGEDTLLVRTSLMRRVQIDTAARRARVEAGALWEQVVAPASEAGLLALHGSSPDVGIAGYSLGGGVGWLVRKLGLATNSLTAVELVTADGELVRADAEHEPELFWALRGGGGNFGVVTALEFALYPIEHMYAGWLIWPWEHSERVLQRWAEWTVDAPEEMTSVGRILQLPSIPDIPEPLRGRDIVVVEAAYTGDPADGERLLRPLRELGPEMDTFAAVPPAGLMRLHADPEGPTPAVVDHVLTDRLPRAAVESFLAAAGPGSASQLISAEIRHLGGAAGRPAAGGGALSHVDAEYMSVAVGVPMTPDAAAVQQAQADAVAASLAPWGRGRSYLNLAERPTDTGTAYGAGAYARLRAVRRAIDPDGVFRANHEIPVASAAASTRAA